MIVGMIRTGSTRLSIDLVFMDDLKLFEKFSDGYIDSLV